MSYRYRVVTVFGGSGFIGRHLIGHLAKTEAVIRVATRHPSRANFLRTAGAVGQIVPIAVNLADEGSVAAAVRGADVVINLVGILHETRGNSFQLVQAEAPGRIAAAAKAEAAERVIQLSAIGANAHSHSRYAHTKALGERAALDAFAEATIVRPSIVFGPEDDFFNRFAGMARLMPALPLIGGGGTRLQPVYVGDVAAAIMAVIDEPATRGRTLEIGGPRIYSFKELLTLMLAMIGRRRLLIDVPWSAAELLGRLLEKLPNPPLTRDQVELLKTDNVVSGNAPGLKDLGIAPTAVEVILPTYLNRFRPGGRFGRQLPAS